MADVTIVALQAGRPAAVELTPITDSASWSSAAVGGFADASFSLPGPPRDWRRRLPYLTLIRVVYEEQVVWEGQIEDIRLSMSGGNATTQVQCFGQQRLLSETTVRRIWSKRDLDYLDPIQAGGGTKPYDVQIGQFDLTDLTKNGAKFTTSLTGTQSFSGDASFAAVQAPLGLTLTRFRAHNANGGGVLGDWEVVVYDSTDGTAWNLKGSSTAATNDFDTALTAGAILVKFGIYHVNNVVPAANTEADWWNIRLLGTSLNEDSGGGATGGGFYGGTILADLLALVPGLAAGIVDSGSDFVVASLDRAVRDTALSVVQEVASYYTREWAVWEGGRFDWKQAHYDPDWIVPVDQCATLELDGSVDGISRTSYVLYTDAATGRDAEASATATEQSNPYFKQGRAKDAIVQPGFPMTANTSAQLAAVVNAQTGKRVPTTGTISLPAKQMVQNARGGAKPAYTIRAGQNVLLPDLPKDDIFAAGPDGQTLFHIDSAQADLASQAVTLTLTGQAKSIDVILARLAAVTRTLTG